MTTQLGEGQPHFGPAVYLQDDIADQYRSVEVDAVRMGENLRRDFPEISQEEWDTSVVHLTDQLPPYFGGYSANISQSRNSLSARIIQGKATRIGNFLLSQPNVEPTYKELEEMSGGRDIVVAVNLASDVDEPVGKNGRFFPPDEKLDVSTILSHELQHTVGHIAANRYYAQHKDKVNRLWRRVASHVGSAATGFAAGGVGAITAVMSLSPFAETTFFAGDGAMAAGAVLLVSPIYLAIKHNTLWPEKMGIEIPEPPYSYGEDSAHAYALAARESWRDIIRLPDLPEQN
jgi:hypothetical protein